MKYTPAPWTLCGGRQKILASDSHCIRSDKANVNIANVWYTDETHSEDWANANLIAAAPDLFEALQLLYDEVTSLPSWESETDTVFRVKAALSKAKGIH